MTDETQRRAAASQLEQRLIGALLPLIVAERDPAERAIILRRGTHGAWNTLKHHITADERDAASPIIDVILDYDLPSSTPGSALEGGL